MLSKLLPWDFIQKYPQTIDLKRFGIYSFLIHDAYLERAILDSLPKGEVKFSLYTGAEFTREFIEEHFINLSFFNEKEHLLIINAEAIPAASLEFFLESGLGADERFLLFFFNKTHKLMTSLGKSSELNIFACEVESPRFWEGAKLWQFVQKVKSVNYDTNVARFALLNLEHNFESFFWLVDIIKMNFPDHKIDMLVLKELVRKERWDFFELIDLFNHGPKDFFHALVNKEMDYDWMRTLSAFMQTHLIKILFPEEIRAKGKLSKYDQSILDMSEKLNRDVVQYYLGFFRDIEIMAKASDSFLMDRLRLESLKEKIKH
jgi:hypothetical protein